MQNMTVKEFKQVSINLLKKTFLEKNIKQNTFSLDVDLILMNVLNVNRTFLIAHDDRILSEKEFESLTNKINQRKEGLPVAYITGCKEFYGRNFYVNPDVLIPKPDTELMIEKAIETTAELFTKKKKLSVADICTGSGCIIISFMEELKNLNIDISKSLFFASDISEKALEVAEKNARNIVGSESNIKFLCGSLFEPFSKDQTFDIILTNPPYVPHDVSIELLKDGRNEPLLALDGGNDGLDLIKKIIPVSYRILNEGGYIFMETGEYNAFDAAECFSKNCFSYVETFNDLSGQPRLTVARK